MKLTELAQQFLTAKHFAHAAHHLATGLCFDGLHEFFGELYGAYDDTFDSLMEGAIVSKEKVDYEAVISEAADAVLNIMGLAADPKAALRSLAKLETDMRQSIDELLKSASTGIANRLQGIADASLVRSYKIEAHLK